MKSEFALAFNQICAEYGLPREVVLDAVKAALATAYRRDWKVPTMQNITAEISLETGLARIYAEQVVVEDVEDPQTEIQLSVAKRRNSAVQVGETVMVDVTPRDFGRIAAQTAKQVITQRLREAERESQFNRFSRQENEIIIGTIQSIGPQGVTLHLDRTEEAIMPRREQIPGERYSIHSKIRVYVLEVRRSPRGPEVIVSRSHPAMLRRLLELEVPEIQSGHVELKAVAREAGTRAKIAVTTKQPGLDPVGACVGVRGTRIQTISRELRGERIDVVLWDEDPETYIRNALSVPQFIMCITLDEHAPGGKTAAVVVRDDKLSLAIGRSGQNARLAAKLTQWRVDIQGATEAAVWALEQINQNPEIMDTMRENANNIPRLASIMRGHEEDHYPYTDEEITIIAKTVDSVRQAVIYRRNAERPDAQQARDRRSAQRKAEEARVQARLDARDRVPRAAFNVALTDLDLPTKVYSHLIDNGLNNTGEVMERLAMGDEAMLMLNGIGIRSLNDIKKAIEDAGLKLRSEQDEEITTEPEVAAPIEETEADAVVIEDMSEPEPEEVFESEAEPEPVEALVLEEEEELDEAEPEPDLKTDEVGEEFEDFGELLEQLDDDDIFTESGKDKSRGNKKKRRAVFYDDATGETFVVRKHRRSSEEWGEYEEEF